MSAGSPYGSRNPRFIAEKRDQNRSLSQVSRVSSINDEKESQLNQLSPSKSHTVTDSQTNSQAKKSRKPSYVSTGQSEKPRRSRSQVSKLESISESDYAIQIAGLNERALIWWAIKYFLMPCFCISILGTFFPYPQALVPVHESVYCLCYFTKNYKDGRYLLLNIGGEDSYSTQMKILRVINTITFFSVNWIFLVVNIVSVY